MKATSQSTLENLRLALHGISAPFSSQGTYVPTNPVTFVFRDRTRFEIKRAKDSFAQPKALEPLLSHCKLAPFGDGKTTRYDRRVRDAFQLKAEGGAFSIEGFDPESAGILDKIRRELVPHHPNPISAELYAVNVYLDGGHFASHKDTPWGGDMFGSLVVCLPSYFYGGDFVLTHHGVVEKYRWSWGYGDKDKPDELRWAAFFGDVDHRIEEVRGGARISLAYLLRSGGGAPINRENRDLAPHVQEAWQSLLADDTFEPSGAILGYPCCHLYHQDARFQGGAKDIDREFFTLLKGRDHLVAETARQAGLDVAFHPYMFENCGDQTWLLKRFPTRQEKAKMKARMDGTALDKALPIRADFGIDGESGVTWLEDPPSSDNSTWQSKEGNDPELPAAAQLHSCEFCDWGYFGNESSYVDFYTYAALHITIPKFGRGVRAKSKLPKTATAKRKTPARKRKTKDG